MRSIPDHGLVLRAGQRRPRPLLLLISAAGVCASLLSGCAQPFSDLQSAKLVGEGRVEVTGSYSSVSFTDGDTEKVQDNVGFHVATGVSDRADIRVRYERIELDDSDGAGVNVLGLGPKFVVGEDHSAFFIPVGFAFGGDIETSETWEIHPTLLVTGVASDNVELNGSGKLLIPLSSDGRDVLLAFNVGAGLSSNLDAWALRPEVGILVNPGEDGFFHHLSLGLTVFPSVFE